MGRTTAELDRFTEGYGYDMRNWSGLTTLSGLRDLHTLDSFIRRADHGGTDAAVVLRRCLHILRHHEMTSKWPQPAR